MNIGDKLREILLPVFDLDSIDEIKPEDSLIKDLGADSLDFVEIIHLIDRNFGVQITTNEILIAGIPADIDDLFEDGVLTSEGTLSLTNAFNDKKDIIHEGMTKIDLFTILTVRDLANIIKLKIDRAK